MDTERGSYQTVCVVNIIQHKVDTTVQFALFLAGLGLHYRLSLDFHHRLGLVLFALRRSRRGGNGQGGNGIAICGDVILNVLQKVLEVVHRELL